MRFRRSFAAAAFAVAVLCASVASAQSADPAFAKARQARTDAIGSGDAKTYAKYTTDGFILILPNGMVTNRDQAVARVANTKPPAGGAPPQPQHQDEKIDVYGTTIILNWTQSIQGKQGRFTEVWVKDDEIWKCASGHVSMVPDKKE